MNEATKDFLIANYNRLAYTHDYVFGYVQNHTVYAAVVRDCADLLHALTYLDRASAKNGGTYSLKYRATGAIIAVLTARAEKVVAVCSEAYLEDEKARTRHNRGQIFEELVASVLGAKLNTKSNLKFTDGGDIIEADGRQLQVKFTKATFTDERTLHNLRNRH